jgi:hypothetical protein
VEVEGHRPLLELAVNLQRLGEELVDPVGRLREEEAAIATGSSCGDTAGIDEEDISACLCEEARGCTAGEAGTDDNRVVLQVLGVSDWPRRLRQNISAPTVAPTPAAAAAPAAALRRFTFA